MHQHRDGHRLLTQFRAGGVAMLACEARDRLLYFKQKALGGLGDRWQLERHGFD
jgi:hypothetical protein